MDFLYRLSNAGQCPSIDENFKILKFYIIFFLNLNLLETTIETPDDHRLEELLMN